MVHHQPLISSMHKLAPASLLCDLTTHNDAEHAVCSATPNVCVGDIRPQCATAQACITRSTLHTSMSRDGAPPAAHLIVEIRRRAESYEQEGFTIDQVNDIMFSRPLAACIISINHLIYKTEQASGKPVHHFHCPNSGSPHAQFGCGLAHR